MAFAKLLSRNLEVSLSKSHAVSPSSHTAGMPERCTQAEPKTIVMKIARHPWRAKELTISIILPLTFL